MRYHFATKCQHRFSILANTPLKGNRTPLPVIFHIIFLLSIAKNGISAKEVQRNFGMTYKTAWSLLNKIRSMLGNHETLSGDIEMDEAFFGGQKSNNHITKKILNTDGNTKNTSQKTTLIGLKSRTNGNIIINAESNQKTTVIEKNIKKNIKKIDYSITDEWQTYKKVAIKNKWPHLVIEHKYEWYGKKMINTETGDIIHININGIERMWNIIKNSFHNTYKRPSAKLLQNYLDEFSFCFNNRKGDVFLAMIKRVFNYA